MAARGGEAAEEATDLEKAESTGCHFLVAVDPLR